MEKESNISWIIPLLENLIKGGRRGKLAEVIFENGKVIVSCYSESLSPSAWEKFKKGIDLQNFFGQVNFNYSGRGPHTIKLIASLTEEDWNKNKEIFK